MLLNYRTTDFYWSKKKRKVEVEVREKGVIDVVAALVEREGRILVVRRAAGQAQAGKWEFPGGKVEAGESPAAALARELLEELGIEVTVGRRLGENIHSYPGGVVRLSFYAAVIRAGEPVLRVHDRLAWLPPAELTRVDLAAADRPMAAMLAGQTDRNSLQG